MVPPSFRIVRIRVRVRTRPALALTRRQAKRQWLSEHGLLRPTHGTLLNPPPTVGISDRADEGEEERIRSRGSCLASAALRIRPSADDPLTS
jgi:hypothetical protein